MNCCATQKLPGMFNVPAHITEEMIYHAKEDFPLECCGILAGKDDSISHIYRMKNTDSSKVSYLMDPKEQLKVFKEMRILGTEIRAIYHSHPNHPAYPSMTDVELAFYPEVVYIIVSIDNDKNTKVRGFRILNKEITEVELNILSVS